jgi:tRNA pseudouridine38-40 synthase
MRNIKLTIAYDGTGFSGWQRQRKDRSVQGDLEAALEKLHKHPVALTGAGRTDAGVHARGQAANFYTDIARIQPENFVPALNRLLPQDVRVMAASEAAEKFHARFDAKMRTYRYRIIAGRQALPQELRYALPVWRNPDIAALNRYARCLRGEMDCSLFASPADKSLSRFRFINSASFFMEGTTLCFEISANAFLWKMVRCITGSLLFYEERGLPERVFREYLQTGDHKKAGPVAPPQGLTLWKVSFDGEPRGPKPPYSLYPDR